MTETPSSPSSAPLKSILIAVKRLLRPLVRMLITKGIGLPTITDILKDVYVDVANQEFPLAGKRQTDSRISILTGVHRKDVKRLREKAETLVDGINIAAPRSVGLGAQVVARWVGSTETTSDTGQPLPLHRTIENPGIPSFNTLVESVSKDVRPRAVLDEWLRLGVAKLDKEGLVHLNQAAFVPEKGFEEKAFYLGRNVHDHMAAAAHNLLGEGSPTLERSVHYSNLTAESVELLNYAAMQEGMKALLTVNRMALGLTAQDKNKDDATRRVNFGLYFHQGLSIFNTLAHGDGVTSEDAGE